MFTRADDYGRAKKTDARRQETRSVLSLSTAGFCVACLVFLLFVYDGSQPKAARARKSGVQLDEDGFEICHVPAIQRPEEFFDDIETVTADCRSMVQLGKTAVSEVLHGEWGTATKCNETAAHFQWICLDKRLKITPGSCLTYSIGVDKSFTFETDMERLGCEVYAFDTLDQVDDHQRSDRIWFQNIRVGLNSFDALRQGNTVERARNLHQVVESLGHKHRTIDVLKLDIRDHEWEALDEFVRSEVLDQVKQLVITLNFNRPINSEHPHMLMEQLLTYYQLLRMLDCDGFRVFSSKGRGEPVRAHGMKRHFYPEYEISYVNTNFYH
ncbi:methyltransferase-like protein 24 [Pollicipes pollicipes]|uniref:methyltransferase-like protein 24 n=1 Tax=Pollicipes pollicipes TaxID=41117 RepID=UPI0018852A61|nr:methyltransferase-like protein 24 [Pollicipes pollicipes]XP_037083069.1 methyltransferase-like protein 24 [Pollicipes pollicipes]